MALTPTLVYQPLSQREPNGFTGRLVSYKCPLKDPEEGQNFDGFFMELRSLAKNCEYDKLGESLITGRSVCGVVHDTVCEKLLQVDKLMLETCVELCKLREFNAEQMKTITPATYSDAHEFQWA